MEKIEKHCSVGQVASGCSERICNRQNEESLGHRGHATDGTGYVQKFPSKSPYHYSTGPGVFVSTFAIPRKSDKNLYSFCHQSGRRNFGTKCESIETSISSTKGVLRMGSLDQQNWYHWKLVRKAESWAPVQTSESATLG